MRYEYRYHNAATSRYILNVLEQFHGIQASHVAVIKWIRKCPTSRQNSKSSSKLRQLSPIQPGFGKFIGYSQEGQTIWFPGSYLAGYMTVLHNTQVTVVFDLLGLGIYGQLSDDSWAYLPGFRDGSAKALNDLRMAVMAQAHLRTFAEIEEIKKRQEQQRVEAEQEKMRLERERQTLSSEIKSLREELTRFRDESKKNEQKKKD